MLLNHETVIGISFATRKRRFKSLFQRWKKAGGGEREEKKIYQATQFASVPRRIHALVSEFSFARYERTSGVGRMKSDRSSDPWHASRHFGPRFIKRRDDTRRLENLTNYTVIEDSLFFPHRWKIENHPNSRPRANNLFRRQFAGIQLSLCQITPRGISFHVRTRFTPFSWKIKTEETRSRRHSPSIRYMEQKMKDKSRAWAA